MQRILRYRASMERELHRAIRQFQQLRKQELWGEKFEEGSGEI